MQNSAHNGFNCPYCREVLAIVPEFKDEDDVFDYDEEDEEDEDEEDEDEEDEYIYQEYNSFNNFSDNSLTSFRMFHQLLEGIDVEPDNSDDEDYSDFEQNQDEEDENGYEPELCADANYILEKLLQSGITVEDIVKSYIVKDLPGFCKDKPEYANKWNLVYNQTRKLMYQYANCEQVRNNYLNNQEQLIGETDVEFMVVQEFPGPILESTNNSMNNMFYYVLPKLDDFCEKFLHSSYI
jgi:hypothetical protein